MSPARRGLAAVVLLTGPLLVVGIVAVTVMALPVGYLVAMVSLLALIALGLLRQRRWGWWLAIVMGSVWLVGGVLNLVAVATSPLLSAEPWLAPLLACYVVALAAALVLLLTRAGRASFRRRTSDDAPAP